MSHKRREHKRQRHAEAAGGVRWPAVLRAVVLGGGVALLVIGAMVPSESAISDGTYAPLAAGWCLLLVVWAAAMWLDDQPTVMIGWTEAIGAALVGWHSLAALLSLGYTNGRHALNAHWLIVGYGLTAFLFRQTVRTVEQARSLVAAMVWLATLLASLGLYQYFYGMPRQRREYVLEIHASISASQLHVTWIYSRNLHRQATIAALAQAFIAALRALIAHCRSPEAGGYTPSDFPDLELRADELDALLAEFGEH